MEKRLVALSDGYGVRRISVSTSLFCGYGLLMECIISKRWLNCNGYRKEKGIRCAGNALAAAAGFRAVILYLVSALWSP